MAHNLVSVKDAQIRHSLPGTFFIGLMHTVLVTIVEWRIPDHHEERQFFPMKLA
jgi:hypothetical protein